MSRAKTHRVTIDGQDVFGETNQLTDAIADFHNIHAGRGEKNPTAFTAMVKGVVANARREAELGLIRVADCCKNCGLKEKGCPVVGNVYHQYSCEHAKSKENK